MPVKKIDRKQTEAFKKSLIEIKEKILYDIKNMTGNNSHNGQEPREEPSGHGLHMADVATDMYDREFNLGLASNDREILNKVNDALKRIEDRTYGVCNSCKKPIAVVRLKAIPYAEMCRDCQEENEKNA